MKVTFEIEFDETGESLREVFGLTVDDMKRLSELEFIDEDLSVGENFVRIVKSAKNGNDFILKLWSFAIKVGTYLSKMQ